MKRDGYYRDKLETLWSDDLNDETGENSAMFLQVWEEASEMGIIDYDHIIMDMTEDQAHLVLVLLEVAKKQ